MDIWLFFNIAAGVASIIGAIISIWQAKNSTTAAKRAQEVKDQLIAHKQTSEATSLNSAHHNAQRSMEKFGPASTAENLKGISTAKEAQDVQEFYALLKQNRGLFGEDIPNTADHYCDKLLSALSKFSQSKNENEIRANGKNLYIILVDFSPEIKTLMKEKLETIS